MWKAKGQEDGLLGMAGLRCCKANTGIHVTMKRICRPVVRIKYQTVMFLLVLGSTLLPSCTSSSSTSQEQLFDIAISASFDEQQEVLQSDASGTVIGYESEIFITKTNETQPVKLTDNSVDDQFPSLSPDGSMVAFVSIRDGNEEIYVMDIDGTNQTNLTNHPGDDTGPVWSPDGSQIAFTTRRDGNYEIYIMDANGENQTNLTNSPANEHRVSWSPHGSQLAFDSNDGGRYLSIYVIDLGNLKVTKLTNNGANDFDPKWSPDGSKIAFTSDRDGNKEIYLMGHDGSAQTNLTNNIADDFYPLWAIDGEHIIFASQRKSSLIDNFLGDQKRSFVMKSNGSSQVPIPDYSGGWITDICCKNTIE